MSEYIDRADDRKEPFVWLDLEVCNLAIDPASKAVYLEIVRRGRGSNRGCDESMENIAHCANVSLPTAKRAVKKLLDWRMVSKESRPGMPSRYRLTDKTFWATPKLEPPKNKFKTDQEGGSNFTQVREEVAQILPGSNPTWVKNELGGGSNFTQGGSSNFTHKLDPFKLDPITKNIYCSDESERSVRENSVSSKSTDPEENPIASNQPASLIFQAETVTTQTDNLDDKSSGAAKKTPEEKNPEVRDSFIRRFEERMWRLYPGTGSTGNKGSKSGAVDKFKALMADGVAEAEIYAIFEWDLKRRQSAWKLGQWAECFPHLSRYLENGRFEGMREQWQEYQSRLQRAEAANAADAREELSEFEIECQRKHRERLETNWRNMAVKLGLDPDKFVEQRWRASHAG